MLLEISDQVLKSAKMSEMDIQLEIAVMLFEKDKLSLGQASKLACLPRWEFQKVLAQRKIPLHYGVEEFEKDLETIKRLEAKEKISS